MEGETKAKIGNARFFSPDEVTEMGHLGKGSFGIVFKVQVPVNGVKTIAAMKCVGENLSKDLLSEILTLSKIKLHSNLLKFYGAVIIKGQLQFLSEFCEKGSLDQLHHENLTSKERFWQIVKGVLDGLHVFHEIGLVHRDIACRNLFMKACGTVVLGDYGHASHIERGSHGVVIDRKIRIPWAWSAPESLLERKFSQKSDIWMFGVTVYEILCEGKMPHVGLGESKFVSELKEGKSCFKISEDLDEETKSLLKLCFKFSTEERPTALKLRGTIKDQLPYTYGGQ
eukprot:jgi/Bigna1/64848/fgenesh1_kg.87_\